MPWTDSEETTFCYHVDVVPAEGQGARPGAEESAAGAAPSQPKPTRWSVTSLGLPMLITHRKSTTCAEIIDLVAQRVGPFLHGAVAAGAAAAAADTGAGGGLDAAAAGAGSATEGGAGSAGSAGA